MKNREAIPNKLKKEFFKTNYSKWKSKSLEIGGYFVIFNSFKDYDYLKRISGGALKLYIFLGIVSKNDTGESFYSIESIARYFNKSTRTIDKWMQELVDFKLITRMQLEPDSVSHTYLLPY